MYINTGQVTWILYIWIFVLLWKAACVQGEHANKRANKVSLNTNSNKVVRQKRSVDQPTESLPPVQQGKPPPDPKLSEPVVDEKQLKQAKRNQKILKYVLEQMNETSGVQSKHTTTTHLPTPEPLDTGQVTTPPPLDTIQDSRTTSKVKKPKQGKVQTTVSPGGIQDTTVEDVTSENYNTTYGDDNMNTTRVQEDHTDIPKVDNKKDNNLKVATNDQKVANVKESNKTEISQSKNEIHKNKTDKTDENSNIPHKVDNKKQKSLKFIPNDKTQADMKDDNQKEAKADEKVAMLTFDDFVDNVAQKKNKQNKPLKYEKMSTQTVPFEHSLNRVDDLLKLQQKQSLVLLANATKEAEFLQKRLKSHKLKLKSYIDELRNLTASEVEADKKMRNFTKTVRNKVSAIVNPKKQEHELGAHEMKPHFFAKDIPETLRARVDMRGLKKSESFWDKKGEDVDDPHLQHRVQLEADEMQDEDALDPDALAVEYAEDPPLDQSDIVEEEEEEEAILEPTTPLPSRADDLPHELTEDHLNDYHQTRLNEISAQDGIRTRTGHESLIMSQLVSARIHGNILAPPPERCSVSANIKRYRPPEETMKADDSTLYRVNLQPEYDAAIEGAPMDYLRDYKNPCWLSQITDNKGTLWYDYTETGLTYKRMSFLYEMRLSKGSNWRMRCLPYLFLIGVTKGGTTDLYTRMLGHPEIMRPGHKEPMWWNRLTLGMAESLRKPFRYYVDFFDEAAELIRRKVILKDGKPYHPAITVDATPANLWDYDCWTDIPGNRGLSEPKYTLAHSIKKLVPNARILMVLREPTSRLYSQYRMKSHMEPSTTFHKHVMEAIVNFNRCLETRTLRSCAYDYEISKHEFQSPGGVFIRASLYYVFVKDWLEVFPRDQVMIVRTEDYHNNTEGTLGQVFDFLGLNPVHKERMHAINKQRSVNTRADHGDRSMEPMLPETQRLLDDFFAPYNRLLAKLLNDKRFKWKDINNVYDYSFIGD